ncbi:MAG: DUF1579 family protein [Blastocatellia bacterium]
MTKSSTAQIRNTQAPDQPSKPGPEHKRLDVFAGEWNMAGQQYESSFGTAAKISAVESYEWLPGGFFLVHRLEGRLDDQEMACIEIIGHDASSRSYPVHTFYNDGKANEWEARERDGVWTLTGDWPAADKLWRVRCTTVFGESGNTRTSKWERSSNGSKWETFWEVKATKAR